MEDWTQAVTDLGSTAAIIWLLIHIFRVLLPDLVLRFARELEQQRAEYLSALAEFRAEFRSELDRQREALQRLTEAVESLCEQIQKGVSKEVKHGNR